MSLADDRDYYDDVDYSDGYAEYMAELYKEHRQEALSEFTLERLQSYFVANPALVSPPAKMLATARQLAPISSTAAHIFAASATELAIKTLFLRPVVYGLVHSESTAGLVAELAVSHGGMERFRDLLFQVLRDHGQVDLQALTRPAAEKILWVEIIEVRNERNMVLHRGKEVDASTSDRAIAVAAELIEATFPKLVSGIGLHLHESFRICGDAECRYVNPEFA